MIGTGRGDGGNLEVRIRLYVKLVASSLLTVGAHWQGNAVAPLIRGMGWELQKKKARSLAYGQVLFPILSGSKTVPSYYLFIFF